jgi:hypothetical protein
VHLVDFGDGVLGLPEEKELILVPIRRSFLGFTPIGNGLIFIENSCC